MPVLPTSESQWSTFAIEFDLAYWRMTSNNALSCIYKSRSTKTDVKNVLHWRISMHPFCMGVSLPETFWAKLFDGFFHWELLLGVLEPTAMDLELQSISTLSHHSWEEDRPVFMYSHLCSKHLAPLHLISWNLKLLYIVVCGYSVPG